MRDKRTRPIDRCDNHYLLFILQRTTVGCCFIYLFFFFLPNDKSYKARILSLLALVYRLINCRCCVCGARFWCVCIINRRSRKARGYNKSPSDQ